MTSKVTANFWKRFNELPLHVRQLTARAHRLWLRDPRHPAVRFKPFHGRLYSARIGDHYRAVGYFSGPDEFTWIWIGSHQAYNKFRSC